MKSAAKPIRTRLAPEPLPPAEQLDSPPPPFAPGQHAPAVEPEPPVGRQSKPDGHLLSSVVHDSEHFLSVPTVAHTPSAQSASLVHTEPSPPGVLGAGSQWPPLA